MSGDKMTRARVAFALLCGLAVCCSVMYITADAGDALAGESVLAGKSSFTSFTRSIRKSISTTPANPIVHGIGGPSSVDSTDVQKAGQIFTNTPDGRMRLTDYLSNVEREITAEAASRKRDVIAVRDQISRNMAFNEEARKKMKKELLTRMAANAKKADRDLKRMMRITQHRFQRSAALANRRNKSNIKRSLAIRKRVARERRNAAKRLRIATLAQQRSMAAYASAINNRIKQTDKAVNRNAGQIAVEAKKARKALERAVSQFDKKAADAKNLAAAGRSKLAAQLVAQSKATRQWATNRLKVEMAKTNAQFQAVRARMAADRSHADMALKQATTRMTASVDAFKALSDKHFAANVKNIAAARKEAKAGVTKARADFKVRIRALKATVQRQVSKAKARITQLSGTVQKNKVQQAAVNANVRAETDRMILIGNKRYKEHLKKDKELHKLIKENKAANDARLKAMSNSYMAQLSSIEKTMQKNRAHASRMLASKTAALYAAVAKSERNQMKVNGKIKQQTREAKLEVMQTLREAKNDFAKRLSGLHATVQKLDRKFQGKIFKATGIVRKNAAKDAAGRARLRAMMKADKDQLSAAVQDAVHKGEARMQKLDAKLTGMNKKTKASLSMRISSRVSKYRKDAEKQINDLRTQSKAARAALKEELLFAVTSAAKEAKKNLNAEAAKQAEMITAATVAENNAARKSASQRAKLARHIALKKRLSRQMLTDAVGTMTRTLNAMKAETAAKIKKSNRKITAYADRLVQEQKDVKAEMAANMVVLKNKIKKARASSSAAIRAAGTASAGMWRSVDKRIKSDMAEAQKKADDRFTKLFVAMSKQRKKVDLEMNKQINIINDKIAKQAALADSRFQKTVTDIKAARAEATNEVKAARKSFATAIVTTTANIKVQESRLFGELSVVSGDITEWRTAQARINTRTNAELKRITKLANKRSSESTRARGKLRKLLDENKRAAQQEVNALNTLFTTKYAKIRSTATKNARSAGESLKTETAKLYDHLAKVQLAASQANTKSAKAITKYAVASQVAIRAARKSFAARLNTMTNQVSANNKSTQRGLEVLTGVIRNYKANGKKDRALIRDQVNAINVDLQGKIDRYVQKGEAQAKRTADRARANMSAAKKSLLLEISARVEATADKLFQQVQGNHKKLADNYLSLKAYSVTARRKLNSYVAQGKGKNLSSLGSLLVGIGALSDVKLKKTTGVGAGASTIPSIFSSKSIKVSRASTKINALVNEYSNVLGRIHAQWPLGLGKYLLLKLEESMQAKGVLQVDKVNGSSGNHVFVNGHTVGLSNKLNDFESLSVHMHKYEQTLAALTSKLAGKVTVHNKNHVAYVKAPEWKGD